MSVIWPNPSCTPMAKYAFYCINTCFSTCLYNKETYRIIIYHLRTCERGQTSYVIRSYLVFFSSLGIMGVAWHLDLYIVCLFVQQFMRATKAKKKGQGNQNQKQWSLCWGYIGISLPFDSSQIQDMFGESRTEIKG